jgi:hypothetical protein
MPFGLQGSLSVLMRVINAIMIKGLRSAEAEEDSTAAAAGRQRVAVQRQAAARQRTATATLQRMAVERLRGAAGQGLKVDGAQAETWRSRGACAVSQVCGR